MSQDWPRRPERLARHYREQGFWEDGLLDGLLREQAAHRPRHPALISGGERLTYAELDARVDRLATGLAGLPLRRGERVLVQLPNRTEYVVTVFALSRIGAVPILALPALGPADLESLVSISDAAAMIVAPGRGARASSTVTAKIASAAPSVRHLVVTGGPGGDRNGGDGRTLLWDSLLAPTTESSPSPDAPERDPDDLALLLLSGGTTGTPKLIPRTHADYRYNARASAEVSGVDETAVYLAVLPVAHNFTMVSPGIVGTFAVGGTVVLGPDPSPTTAFELIEREQVTISALVPALVGPWLDEARRSTRDLSSLKVVQVGGSRLDEATARRVGPTLDCRLQQVFGMAEGLNNYTGLDDPEDLVCTTQGRPLSPADEVLVVDEQGDPLPAGVAGELLTRGPYTLRGYYRAREPDPLRFTPDGLYRTGDLVTRSENGDLTVVGRVKDQINRAGEKIAAVEVEEMLMGMPGVRGAAVVGLPDPVLGERSVALLVVPERECPTRDEVREELLGRGAAAFKVPDEVRRVGRLPLTGVGKVDKKRLRLELTEA
ncbi:AMP-binding protein [Nocardiopsis alba]|uniref:AMP-binding protein n=1 Tax=Nocardiopsis alba TaxID=53437 RepID=A0A7K2IYA3_9ACTN|nr:AMP-binding protein [Nocardiopsis alba]MYR34807.1 AMP-binding protein [Nocardiopsis alba]